MDSANTQAAHLSSCMAFPGFRPLPICRKGVERNGVSVNLPVFVERELRLSRYLGRNQAKT